MDVYGENHPQVATNNNNIGAAWSDLGDAKKAIEFTEKALQIFTVVYGSDHPSTKTLQTSLNGMKGK